MIRLYIFFFMLFSMLTDSAHCSQAKTVRQKTQEIERLIGFMPSNKTAPVEMEAHIHDLLEELKKFAAPTNAFAQQIKKDFDTSLEQYQNALQKAVKTKSVITQARIHEQLPSLIIQLHQYATTILQNERAKIQTTQATITQPSSSALTASSQPTIATSSYPAMASSSSVSTVTKTPALTEQPKETAMQKIIAWRTKKSDATDDLLELAALTLAYDKPLISNQINKIIDYKLNNANEKVQADAFANLLVFVDELINERASSSSPIYQAQAETKRAYDTASSAAATSTVSQPAEIKYKAELSPSTSSLSSTTTAAATTEVEPSLTSLERLKKWRKKVGNKDVFDLGELSTVSRIIQPYNNITLTDHINKALTLLVEDGLFTEQEKSYAELLPIIDKFIAEEEQKLNPTSSGNKQFYKEIYSEAQKIKDFHKKMNLLHSVWKNNIFSFIDNMNVTLFLKQPITVTKSSSTLSYKTNLADYFNIDSLSYNKAGTLLFTAASTQWKSNQISQIYVWNDLGKQIDHFPGRGVNYFTLSPDETKVLMIENKKTLTLLDSSTGEKEKSLEQPFMIRKARYNAQGSNFFILSTDTTTPLLIFETKKTSILLWLRPPAENTFSDAAWLPDGNYIATTLSPSNTILLWDTTYGASLHKIKDKKGEDIKSSKAPVFSSDSTKMIADNNLWEVKYNKDSLNMQTKNMVLEAVKIIFTLKTYQTAHFSPDNTKIMILELDGTISIRSAMNGALLATISGKHKFTGAIFHPNGNKIATISRDNIAQIWDVSFLKNLTFDQFYLLSLLDYYKALIEKPGKNQKPRKIQKFYFTSFRPTDMEPKEALRIFETFDPQAKEALMTQYKIASIGEQIIAINNNPIKAKKQTTQATITQPYSSALTASSQPAISSTSLPAISSSSNASTITQSTAIAPVDYVELLGELTRWSSSDSSDMSNYADKLEKILESYKNINFPKEVAAINGTIKRVKKAKTASALKELKMNVRTLMRELYIQCGVSDDECPLNEY